MADIKKELNAIKNAVYGREVRSSIHDGIKKINDEAENAADLSESAKHQVENIQQQVNQLVVEGDSSVEAAQARVDAEGKSFPTLKARLDAKETEFSSKLAQIDEQVCKNAPLPLGIRTYDGSNQTVHPDVLFFDTGWNGYKFWMVHTPYPYSDEKLENPSIVASNDGIYWDEPKGLINPIVEPTEQELIERAHYSDATLVMNGDTMECWYRYVNREKNLEQIHRKTSTNGIDWSEKEVVYSLGGSGSLDRILSPTVLYEDGKYKMWYVTNSPNNIFYTESTDGKSNWSTPIPINVSWAEGERASSFWHIDVTKDGNDYNLIINTGFVGRARTIAWATSNDGINFKNCKTILTAPVRGWDSGNLYRASLVKVERDNYMMFYSARTSDHYWQIGVVAGESIDRMKGVISYNRHGNFIVNKLLLNELDFRGDSLRVNKELIFRAEDGAMMCKIVITDDGTLEVLDRNGKIIYAGLKVHALHSTQFRPLTEFGFRFYGDARFGSNAEGVRSRVFIEDGNGKSVGLMSWGDEADTLEILKGSGASHGNIRLGHLILSGTTPALEVEGAVRYSKTQKKLQFYNGTNWETIESS